LHFAGGLAARFKSATSLTRSVTILRL
jgi:hypothetical protein